MAWIRIDDQIADHPKFLKAGAVASWLWVSCLAYCQRYLTDGFIPEQILPRLGTVRNAKALAERLVEVRLLERVEGGYRVHDYLEYNSSAQEVKSDREWDRTRKELYANPKLIREIRERDLNRCRYCDVPVSWTDRRGPHGGQFDHIEPRGPNTIDNLVIACRRCNCAKNNRRPEDAGMVLLPAPSASQNNGNGTSSEPSQNQVYARARLYPSHPIPSLSTKTEKQAHQTSAATSTTGNGNGHASLSPSDPFVNEAITMRAGEFVRQYEALYQKCRNGALYAVRPAKDYASAVTLCHTWADDAHLLRLAKIFLTTDHKFAVEGSRTITQFLALASWCDGRLADVKAGKT